MMDFNEKNVVDLKKRNVSKTKMYKKISCYAKFVVKIEYHRKRTKQ